MATRRPLVRISGRTQQLPAGDVLAGVAQSLPVYQSDQSDQSIVLISLTSKIQGYVLPVYQAAGAIIEVPL